MRITPLLVLLAGFSSNFVYADEPALEVALKAPSRTAEYAARDEYRHPAETLAFFGLRPDMTVVEIWPGAGGWYTEILAPLLRDNGKLYAAQFNEDSSSAFYRNSREAFLEKIHAMPEVYEQVAVTAFNPPGYMEIAPENSADMVLTFRNVHNWYMRGGGDERVIAAFTAMYKALKPGGILGVVDHRLPADRPLSDQEASGYMNQDYVVRMATEAGFELVASAEINANPNDSASHPEGVWTLPPSLRMGDTERERYLAIGESDRMTLKFRKPAMD
ncbi:Uncharacterised protein [Halioglobus japonicus]|nr:Uncharacterised protein [Halioglobus japonicus]